MVQMLITVKKLIIKIMQDKISKFYKLNLDWRLILNFVFIFTYFIYGTGTRIEGYRSYLLALNHIFIELVVFGSFLLYNHYALRNRNYFYQILIINKFKIHFTIIILLIFFLLNFEKFHQNVNGDHLSHIFGALFHPIFIINFFKNSQIISLFQYKSIVWLLLLVMFILYYFIIIYIKKNYKISNILIIAFLGLLLRYIYIYIYEGIPHTHPPFRYFFIQFGGLFGGISNFGFRIVGLITLIPIVYIFSPSSFKFSSLNRILLIFLFLSTPILFETAILVEQSIYFFIIAFILLYLFIWHKKKFSDNSIIILLSLLVIVTLTRITTLSILLSFLVINYKTFYYEKRYLLLLPILILMPFFISLLISQHPALHTNSTDYDYNLSNYKLLPSILYSSLYNNFWYFSFLLLLIPFFFFKKKLEVFILLIIPLIMFYSVRYTLWGVGRYQLEIWGPIFFNLIFAIFIFLKRKTYILSIVLFLAIIFNFYFNSKIIDWNKVNNNQDYYLRIKKTGGLFVKSEDSVPIQDVLNFTNLNFKYLNLVFFNISDDYSIITPILSGYNVKDIYSFKYKKVYNINQLSTLIKNNTYLLFVFSESYYNSNSKTLLKYNFTFVKKFRNNFGEALILLKKAS
jgi:hypothetical protein